MRKKKNKKIIKKDENIRWANNIGQNLIESCSFAIGGKTVASYKNCRFHGFQDNTCGGEWRCYYCYMNDMNYWIELKLDKFLEEKVGKDVTGIIGKYIFRY